MTCAAEDAEFPAQSFDIISCGQSWLYFDTQRMMPLVKTWLKPGGKLVLTYLSWLPRKDSIAQASEQLILRYNPQWTDADFPGSRTIQHAWSQQDFRLVTIMPMRKASRSHEIVGVGESVLAGGLVPPYVRTRWHALTRSMTSYSDRSQRRNLPFCVRYGCMRIRP